MQTHPPSIIGPGYTKQRGESSERNDMVIEVQNQVSSANEGSKGTIWLRVRICPKKGDRPLTDYTENAIEVSLESALAFASAIQAEVAAAQQTLDELSRFPGNVHREG